METDLAHDVIDDPSYFLNWKEIIIQLGGGYDLISPINGVDNGIDWQKIYGMYKINPDKSFIHLNDESYHVYLALNSEAKVADIAFLQARIITIYQVYPENFSPRHIFKNEDSAAHFLDQLAVPLPIFLPEATSAADYLNAMGIPHVVLGVGKKSYIKIL